MAENYGEAFFKAQVAASQFLPLEGTVLITVSERDRAGALEAARRFTEAGFSIVATDGTRKFLERNGVPSRPILKVHEGRPNITDAIKTGRSTWCSTPRLGRPARTTIPISERRPSGTRSPTSPPPPPR